MICKYLVLHYVKTMLTIMTFLDCKMSFHWKWIWVKSYFYHSTRIKWKIQVNDKKYCCFTLVKQGVFNNPYKSILVHLHKRLIMNQFHIHSLWTCFISLKHKTKYDFYNNSQLLKFMFYYFSYYMYFQFWFHVSTLHHANAL